MAIIARAGVADDRRLARTGGGRLSNERVQGEQPGADLQELTAIHGDFW